MSIMTSSITAAIIVIIVITIVLVMITVIGIVVHAAEMKVVPVCMRILYL